MIIEFGQDYLEELYFLGHARNKKYRFQPEIVKNYIEVVNTLINATKPEELYRLNSLHYEKKDAFYLFEAV